MRLSRGRSTPTRRATVVCFLLLCGGLFPVRSRIACRGPASDRTWMSGVPAHWCWEVSIQLFRYCWLGLSALPLLVTGIGADHHDPPMPADHPALVADRLDARVHLHGCVDPSRSIGDVRERSSRSVVVYWSGDCSTCSGTRCGPGTGRRARAPPRRGPRAGCGCSAAASCR